MSLRLENISKSYASKSVLTGLTLNVNKGELIGLLGRNGAGKSTTFKLITGLTQPNEGEIKWDGENVETQSIGWKKKIGYLSEQNPLYPDMYVKQFLNYVCDLHNLKNYRSKIDGIINQLGLEEYSNKKINTLSKGFKQRVGIAQAIINDPELLILDEPTSGLDPTQLVEIRSFIKSLSKDRIVILSSHILSEVEEMCTRVVFLKDGKLTTSTNSKGSILEHVVMRLEFDSEYNSGWFSELGSVEVIGEKIMQIRIKNLEMRKALFDTAVSHSLRILEMNDISNSLETEFLNQTL